MILSDTGSAVQQYLQDAGHIRHTVSVPCCSETEDAAPMINRIIDAAEDGTRILFECGRYLLHSPILLRGKKHIVLDGCGSVFLQHFIPEEYACESSDIMHVEECEDITLRHFTVDTDHPANISGTITAVGEDSVDFVPHPDIPFTGDEKYIYAYTYSPHGYPTYNGMGAPERDYSVWDMVGRAIPCTNPRALNMPHEKIDSRTVRIHRIPHTSRYKPGDLLGVRYGYYGPVAILFRHAHRVLVEEVSIRSFGGMCFVVLPRCSDFTFLRVQVGAAEPSRYFCSSNADGIHTNGLMGKLTLKDCTFRNLGDDFLNAHTQIMDVTAAEENHIRIRYNKVNGYIPDRWAMPGDVLHVYDPATLRRKQDIVVKELQGDLVCADPTDVSVGDLIVNNAYQPEIMIDNCTCWNLRSRAFVLQGVRKATVKNCTFRNVTGAAIYISCAFQEWLEGGPAKNVEIYNNLISGCDTPAVWSTSYAALTVWMRGTFAPDRRNIHENISVHDNVFENLAGRPVYVSDVNTFTLRDNIFTGCTWTDEPIKLLRCTECTVENNRFLQ